MLPAPVLTGRSAASWAWPKRAAWQDHEQHCLAGPGGRGLWTEVRGARQGPQMESFRLLAGKALTTLLAGFAATRTSFPNIIFFPAFRAGLCFNFSLTNCGIVNCSVFATSAYATSRSSANTARTCFGFNSVFSATWETMVPLVMAFFIAFMGAMASAEVRGCDGAVAGWCL